MEIKVLGAGCSKCKATYAAIEKVMNTATIQKRIFSSFLGSMTYTFIFPTSF